MSIIDDQQGDLNQLHKLYDENIKYYPGSCKRSEAENFLIENASFIEY